MIRYYLSEEPILPKVKTFLGADETDLAYILDHLDELVVKAVDGSGGYGMLIGPASTATERTEFKRRHQGRAARVHRPADDRAQPRCRSSSTSCGRRTSTSGPSSSAARITTVVPGGLTRAAMEPGSLVVNSSQGGGSKDTWVLRD